ncbi:MAG: hypothetical protein GQ532_02315 [Methylomarinum sp.]|nr:hypothetical protein [Methylomarinum sp.]
MRDLNKKSDECQIRWGRPSNIVGGRSSIKSKCGLFCITKKDGEYQPLRLKGSIWVSLDVTNDISAAKSSCEAFA